MHGVALAHQPPVSGNQRTHLRGRGDSVGLVAVYQQQDGAGHAGSLAVVLAAGVAGAQDGVDARIDVGLGRGP